MTSAERVIEYSDLKPEESPVIHHSIILPPQWPIGSIVFENMSFRYSSNSPWVLHKINISIRPGEKVKMLLRSKTIILLFFYYRSASSVGQVLVRVQLFNHYFVWSNFDR